MRTIECGLRLMGSWQLGFEVFRHDTKFTDENIVLMLGSMIKQADFLIEHTTKDNWILMECTGIYTFAAVFPEFLCSVDMRAKAIKILLEQLEIQILPDGFQYELSPDYHFVFFLLLLQDFSLDKGVWA